LKESNALLERRKLLKELFFSELPVQETALVVVRRTKSMMILLLRPSIGGARQLLAAASRLQTITRRPGPV
jgi:hypothetical protein